MDKPNNQQETTAIPPVPQNMKVSPADSAVDDSDRTLRLVAFILNLLSTISVGWLLIPLAWMIPMTVVSYGIYKGSKQNTVAFGVCTLLFVNVISGVLLLISKKDA